jgi:hypothetical protein
MVYEHTGRQRPEAEGKISQVMLLSLEQVYSGGDKGRDRKNYQPHFHYLRVLLPELVLLHTNIKLLLLNVNNYKNNIKSKNPAPCRTA